MCGIVGTIGLKNPKDYIVNGLKKLEYRGYDSAGIAFLNQDIQIIKDKGNVDHLATLLPLSFESAVAIGHTRWATHGEPTKVNSHPHLSFFHNIALVHNGIIDNYLEIKQFLSKEGYRFISSSDSEVIANLIEYHYLQCHDMIESLKQTTKMIKGSYALAIINKNESDCLYVMKNNSPLLIGQCQGYQLVSSDAGALIEYTNSLIKLEDYEYGRLTKDRCEIYDKNHHTVNKTPVSVDLNDVEISLNGYPHFMLKEIEESPHVIQKVIDHYCYDHHFHFDQTLINSINMADDLIFIACGTSYHACLFGKRYFEEMKKTVSIYYASEWASNPIHCGKRPFIILLSQSGETGDVIQCQKIINEKNIPHLVVTNTSESALIKNSTHYLLLYAGKEVAVASSKTYVSQIALLAVIAKALVNEITIVDDLKKCIDIINEIKTYKQQQIMHIALAIKEEKDVLFLGRGYDYFVALEASLKLKEISYIHSEAFPGGEIKHGPIALVEKNTPVIIFNSDESCYLQMRNNIEEVKARGAKTYVIAKKSTSRKNDDIIVNDYPSYLTSLVLSIFAFYLAYYVALLKNLDIDKPRNLAKSVTVS